MTSQTLQAFIPLFSSKLDIKARVDCSAASWTSSPGFGSNVCATTSSSSSFIYQSLSLTAPFFLQHSEQIVELIFSASKRPNFRISHGLMTKNRIRLHIKPALFRRTLLALRCSLPRFYCLSKIRKVGLDVSKFTFATNACRSSIIPCSVSDGFWYANFHASTSFAAFTCFIIMMISLWYGREAKSGCSREDSLEKQGIPMLSSQCCVPSFPVAIIIPTYVSKRKSVRQSVISLGLLLTDSPKSKPFIWSDWIRTGWLHRIVWLKMIFVFRSL